MNNEIPGEPGVYSLIIETERPAMIRIGRLGLQSFPKGMYTYTGSALGRGASGLRGRIRRHLRSEKRERWHLDYLLGSNVARIRGVVYLKTMERIECKVSQSIERGGRSQAVVEGFGSSDCRLGCRAHLHYLPRLGESGTVQHVTAIYQKIGRPAFISIRN